MELEELEGFDPDELELDGLLLELLDGFEADDDGLDADDEGFDADEDGFDADEDGFDADEDGFDGLLPSATASNIHAVI